MKRKFRRYVKAIYLCIASLVVLMAVNILQSFPTGFQSQHQFSRTMEFNQMTIQKSPNSSTNTSTLHLFTSGPLPGLEKHLAKPNKFRIINEWRDKQPHDQTTGSDVILRLGYQRPKLGFLTIGLSTVPRVGATYLLETLGSLLEAMGVIEKTEVVIVIFLASLDETWVTETVDHLEDRFNEQIKDGMILVVQPKSHIYPDLRAITKRNFNDSLVRVHWRTKQNIDYAHLFSYCKNISQYYIHIEDDITPAENFISDIKNYIFKNENRTWFCIDFSSLGFIGKLFHSHSLQLICDFLLMFKEEMPCDLLLNHLKLIMMQGKGIRSRRSLFQHRGVISSLENKKQILIDGRFKDNGKLILHRKNFKKRRIANPSAVLTTNLIQYRTFSPDKAYIFSETDYFWAKSPARGSYYTIEFEKPVNLTHIFVQTGHPNRGTDKLEKGEIRLGLPVRLPNVGNLLL